METVRIETTQNVALHYEVATIVDRGLAVAIDWLVLAGWSIVLMVASDELDLYFPDWIYALLVMVPWTFYHLVCELLMDGQSLGKRARNIKVARLDGGQPGLGHYLLRWMLRLIDSLFFIGAVVILFNGKGQRIGDIAAGTTVISLKRRGSLAGTLALQLPDDHQVTFPDAARLPDAHARLIKEVLANTSAARNAAIEKLAERFHAEFSANGLPPEQFLRTLLADHIHLTAR
ncbi:MAG: RDD family protein [Flavobacteriales bacterium]|nr:RDD family protein [Flavobacteriales bacterium]MBP9080559.1 RDD family protein [Flavobacteriales bacterium]